MSHEGHDGGGMSNMTPGSMSGGSMNSSSSDMMMMHMSFYWGKDAVILFSGWPENSIGMYILALCFIFLLGLAVEVLSASPPAVVGSKCSGNSMFGVFVQTCVYSLRMVLAYLVMLSVMSYNIGVLIVAVAGHTAGFFLVKARALAVASRVDRKSSSNGTINSTA